MATAAPGGAAGLNQANPTVRDPFVQSLLDNTATTAPQRRERAKSLPLSLRDAAAGQQTGHGGPSTISAPQPAVHPFDFLLPPGAAVENNAVSFHVAQQTALGDACLLLANLNNRYSDVQLWRILRGKAMAGDLECEILVQRAVDRRTGQWKVFALVQCWNIPDTLKADDIFSTHIGGRPVVVRGGKGHIILAVRHDGFWPSRLESALLLVGEAGMGYIDSLRLTLADDKKPFRGRVCVEIAFKTVGLCRDVWQSLKLGRPTGWKWYGREAYGFCEG